MFRIETHHAEEGRTHDGNPTAIAANLPLGEGPEDEKEEYRGDQGSERGQDGNGPGTAEARRSKAEVTVRGGFHGQSLGSQRHHNGGGAGFGGGGGSAPKARISGTRIGGISTKIEAGAGPGSGLRTRFFRRVEDLRRRTRVCRGARDGGQGFFSVVLGRRARRASVHWKRRRSGYSSSA